MVQTLVASGELDSLELPGVFPSYLVRGGLTLALAALAGAWIVHRLPAAAPHSVVAVSQRIVAQAPVAPRLAPAAPVRVAENPYGALLPPSSWAARNPPLSARRAVVAAIPKAAADPYGAIFDPGFSSGARRLAAASPQAGSGVEPASPARKEVASLADEAAPLPPLRPNLAGAPVAAPRPAGPPAGASISQRRFARNGRGGPAAAPDDRNVFQKLFGLGKPAGPALAYASAEGDVARQSVNPLRAASEASGPSSRYDRWTAVYDLAAHTVYLPDGTRLEAHSGLGNRLDDPAHVNERDRGATPPHLYELKARDELFHGVQALRLDPVGGGDIFGRAGFLAHSYMLGPNGDSNGCVSFKDYQAFLQAFQSGQVKRLAVVARVE